jgi:hypothetical protein
MFRSVRVPLAWLDREESVVFQLGHIPGPNEDKAPCIEKWARAKAAVALRPQFTNTAVIEPLPASLEARGQKFIERPDLKQAMQGLEWHLRMVDLSTVLAFQKQIMMEQIEARVEGMTAEDLDGLFSLAFPDEKNEDLTASMDYAARSTTFTSLNPNLNVAFQGAADVAIPQVAGQPPKAMKMFGFIISIRPSFIQAVEYHGRVFIRDGYHRCLGLLRKGITRVPAIMVHARTFQQLGCNGPGFLREEILLSERPPFLRDLLDDSVSTSVQQVVTRKVVRIRADEFTLEL